MTRSIIATILVSGALIAPVVAGDVATPLSAYKAYSLALNNGSAYAATAAFSENARMIAGETCVPEKPCLTRAAIATSHDNWVAEKLRTQSLDEPQILGDMVIARVGLTWDGIESLGVERMVGTDFVQVKDGLIVQKYFFPDPNDPQTAKILRLPPTK